jgi:hypothetical protein
MKALANRSALRRFSLGLPPADTVPGQVGELLDGDFIRHLEAEEKILRHLRQHAFEVAPVGKPVIGAIDADGFEDLGVFAQAVLLEPGFRHLAPVFVAAWIVKHSTPAGVFPRRRADEGAALRQFGSSLLRVCLKKKSAQNT